MHTSDTLVVRHRFYHIFSPKIKLLQLILIEIYNQFIQQKLLLLNNVYIGLRKIKGDGNCYYRSIIVGIFEAIYHTNTNNNSNNNNNNNNNNQTKNCNNNEYINDLNHSNDFYNNNTQTIEYNNRIKQKYKYLLEIFQTINLKLYNNNSNSNNNNNINNKLLTIIYNNIIQSFQSASEGKQWNHWSQIEQTLLSTNNNNYNSHNNQTSSSNATSSLSFDLSLILLCKLLVKQYILLHQNDIFNGITLKDALLSCYEDVQ